MVLSDGFGVIVLNDEGRVIDYSVPLDMPPTLLREAVSLSYDVYRTVSVIARELGYQPPKNLSLKLDGYEVTIFRRYNKLVVAIIYGEKPKPVVRASEAVVES